MRLEERGLGTGALVGIVVGVVVAVVVPVTIVAVLLIGGGGASFATPQDTITTAINASNTYDADTLYNCFSTSAKARGVVQSIDTLRTYMQQAENMNVKATGLQISNVNILGDTATAAASYTLSYTSEGQTISGSVQDNYQLVKEGGQWKIDNYVSSLSSSGGSGGAAPGNLPVYSGATHLKSTTQDSTSIAYYDIGSASGSDVYNWYKNNVPAGWTLYGESGYTSGSGGYIIYTKGNETAAAQVLEGSDASAVCSSQGISASKILGLSYSSVASPS